jgi:hypothetical protein
MAICGTVGQISLATMAAAPGPWPARLAWAALPLTLGPALGDALDERSSAVADTGSVVAWLVWAAVLLAVAVPRTVSLTALRIAAPLAAGVGVWAALAGSQAGADVVAAAWGAVVLVAAFAPGTGDVFVDGSSYGDERRMLLRPPLALVLGPLPLTWAATVAGPVAAPLLLAAEAWALGAAVGVVGLGAAAVGARALHGLSRRWVVFVPTGVVLHDLHLLADPVLFPRSSVARLGPALAGAGPEVLDLTGGALGLALQLDLREPLQVAPRRGTRALDVVDLDHLRFTPTRPGAVLAEAGRRRLAVG